MCGTYETLKIMELQKKTCCHGRFDGRKNSTLPYSFVAILPAQNICLLWLQLLIMPRVCCVCGGASPTTKCPCADAWYCGSECQRKHWYEGNPSHRRSCALRKLARTRICFACGTYAACNRCLCGNAWYCSSSCQKKHWLEEIAPHRRFCVLYKVRCVLRERYKLPSHVITIEIESFLGKRKEAVQPTVVDDQTDIENFA